MPDKHENIDKLFQEAASGAQVEFNPAAWDKMEALLDKEQPIGGGGMSWRGFYLLSALLILLIGGYLLLPSGEQAPIATLGPDGVEYNQRADATAVQGGSTEADQPTSGTGTVTGGGSSPETATTDGQSPQKQGAGTTTNTEREDISASEFESQSIAPAKDTTPTAGKPSQITSKSPDSNSGTTTASEEPVDAQVDKPASAAAGTLPLPADPTLEKGDDDKHGLTLSSPGTQVGSTTPAFAEKKNTDGTPKGPAGTSTTSAEEQATRVAEIQEEEKEKQTQTGSLSAKAGTVVSGSTSGTATTGEDKQASGIAEKQEDKKAEQGQASSLSAKAGSAAETDDAHGTTGTKSDPTEEGQTLAARDSRESLIFILSPKEWETFVYQWEIDNRIPDWEKHLASLEQPETIRPEKEKQSRWLLSLQAGPAISGVKMQNTSPDNLTGIALEYAASPRISLSAGVNRILARYGSPAGDYTIADRPIFSPGDVSWIDGRCVMIDIPLNVKYQFLPDSENNLFISTGISSYLMASEDYTYFFWNNNDTWDWSVSGTKDLFSIWNVSAGYQKSLNGRWLIGVEPFVKVPLSGIGISDVKLLSAGTYFSLTYKIPPGR